ncbi:MAG: dienelactone hydrolase family protein [Burkholderiaceae bacterium]
MTVHWESTEVEGQPMRIYVGAPERPGPQPVVLIAQHGGGLDAQIQDGVHRLHRAGYIVAAPELYHRQAADVDPTKRTSLLRDDEIIADLRATIAHLRAGRELGPIGIIGFCMGGRVAYLAAGSMPELQAAVVFYGGNIMKALGDGPSPFERTADIQCPVLGLFGAQDTNPSPEDVQRLSAELTRLGKWHEFHTYQDAGHAFQNFIMPERYRERAATASWAQMLAFLKARLSAAA